MEAEAREIAPHAQEEDAVEASLRPQELDAFIGQEQAKKNLSVFVKAARSREDVLDHVLLYGPPGLGKTTLAQIVSKEMGVGFRATSGPILTKAGDLAAILSSLQEGDVLFIDEIHRLNPAVEEVLYPAMEDYILDIIIGEGPAARTVRIDLPRFTLVGATTRLGLIANPLRDRFGIPLQLQFYDESALVKVIQRAAEQVDVRFTDKGAHEVARRSRGTPRIALRLMRRVRDFAAVEGASEIDENVADKALQQLDVDARGLDHADRRYLRFIAEKYRGGPVGVDTIAAGLSEERDAIEDTIEPFLLQQGLLQRTPRGRMLAPDAWAHLGLTAPENAAQPDMLDDA